MAFINHFIHFWKRADFWDIQLLIISIRQYVCSNVIKIHLPIGLVYKLTYVKDCNFKYQICGCQLFQNTFRAFICVINGAANSAGIPMFFQFLNTICHISFYHYYTFSISYNLIRFCTNTPTVIIGESKTVFSSHCSGFNRRDTMSSTGCAIWLQFAFSKRDEHEDRRKFDPSMTCLLASISIAPSGWSTKPFDPPKTIKFPCNRIHRAEKLQNLFFSCTESS